MGGQCTPEYIARIKALADQVGYEQASDQLGLSRETVRRMVRRAKALNGKPVAESKPAIMRKLRERFSDAELAAIANGQAINPNHVERPVIDFDGDEVVVGFVTDTHIGEETFHDSLWESFLAECDAQGVELILHAGDVHEGMSNRPDQVYHLTDVGVSAQMAHAERLLSMTDIPIKVIDGNHDRWGVKSNGLFMVRDLADRLEHVEFIGSDSGEIEINGTRWMLWHGEDGSSYATSYRIQKLVEAFTGGDKPQVLLCGHTHKQGYFFERNVHAVSGGALSYQSSWMKATRKACHTGFHIIRAMIREGEVASFTVTWYPFYR